MQTEANNLYQSGIRGDSSSKDCDQTLNLQLLSSENEETPQEGTEWLNQEFNRLPYKLYRCWIILTFGIVGLIIVLYMKDIWSEYKGGSSFRWKTNIAQFVLVNILHTILLFGCSQMLLGMMKKRADIAQKGIIKFQISMVGSILYSWGQVLDKILKFNGSDSLAPLLLFGEPLIIALHLLGGFAVIKVFKKNHPLARESVNGFSTDFLQQNEAIESEILKYDQQLNSWPYLIYKLWLVLSSLYGTLSACRQLTDVFRLWPLDGMKLLESILAFTLLSLNSGVNYELVFALRRKILIRSRRAIFGLKIYISGTVILYIIFSAVKGSASKVVFVSLICLSVSLITLIGALKANKILEQRDEFAKFSNFNDNSVYI